MLEIPFFRSQKGPTKPKNHTNSTKEFSEQFEGNTGHYPAKQGFRPESSRECSAKSLSHSFFAVPFVCPIFICKELSFKSRDLGPLRPRSRQKCSARNFEVAVGAV